MTPRTAWLVSMVSMLAGCSPSSVEPDAGAPDTPSVIDAADLDARAPDDVLALDGGLAPACVCEAGASAACDSLGSSFTGGSARCHDDCTGYDVSACTADRSGRRLEIVYPALRDERFADARCNDGTPFDFRVSLTGSSRWIINFEGGGMCDGVLVPCARRLASSPGLFSSENDPDDGTMAAFSGNDGSITSRDAVLNPAFHDANVVIANYCSSDLWTGQQTVALEGDVDFDLFFAGRLNARAMMEILQQRYGLEESDALEIIVTGGSAGGNGARNNADLFAEAFPEALADHRVMTITIAGFQGYDWRYPGAGVGGTDLADPDAFDLAYERFAAGLNTRCLALAAAEGAGPGACFTGLWATRSLVAPPPTGYGMRVLDATNRTDLVYLTYHAISASETEVVDAWEALITEEMVASGVRWLLAPAKRGAPNLHGMSGVWDTPFPPHDPTTEPCSTERPAGIDTYSDLVEAFYAETDPSAPGVRICIGDDWPE
jgi:hypothetical protein